MVAGKVKAICGIDPGKSGGIAVLTNKTANVTKMPEGKRDLFELFRYYSQDCNTDLRVYLEKVHAFPMRGQSGNSRGVSGSFNYGKGIGHIEMALTALNIDYEEVPPQRWQKQLLGRTSKGDKHWLKEEAQKRFPDTKVTLWSADALLIAEYGRSITSA